MGFFYYLMQGAEEKEYEGADFGLVRFFSSLSCECIVMSILLKAHVKVTFHDHIA